MVSFNFISEAIQDIINCASQSTSNTSPNSMPKIVPTSSTGEIPIIVDFMFSDKRCSFKISIPKSVYEGAIRSCKIMRISMGQSEREVKKYFYKSFIYDEMQKSIIKSLISKFREYRKRWNLSNDEYAELLVTYVQNIPYDIQKCDRGDSTPRFIVETLVDNKGICSDKSLLMSCLLSEEGFNVSLLEFNQEKHMKVGIAVRRGYDFKNTGYASIETTCLSYIGDDSSKFTSMTSTPKMNNLSSPSVIPIREEGCQYLKISDVKLILDMEKDIDNILNKLKQKIDNFGNSNYDSSIMSEYNSYVSLYWFMRNKRPNRTLIIKEIEKYCV